MDKELSNMRDNVYTECSINCSICKDDLCEFNTNDIDFVERCLRDGWRATGNNIYCPICAKKRLKPKNKKANK